jgi:hypothetical protein
LGEVQTRAKNRAKPIEGSVFFDQISLALIEDERPVPVIRDEKTSRRGGQVLLTTSTYLSLVTESGGISFIVGVEDSLRREKGKKRMKKRKSKKKMKAKQTSKL